MTYSLVGVMIKGGTLQNILGITTKIYHKDPPPSHVSIYLYETGALAMRVTPTYSVLTYLNVASTQPKPCSS